MANFPGLVKRRGIFYYRVRVPGDIQTAFGRKEIWRSLDTADKSQARQRFHNIAAGLLGDFEEKRKELAARHALSNLAVEPSAIFYDVNAIARKHYQDVTDREEAKGIVLFQLSRDKPKEFRRRVYVPSECVVLLDFHYQEAEVATFESWLDYLYGEGDIEKVVAFIERKRLQGRLATIRKARAARNLGEFVALADQLAPNIGDAQRRQLIRALTDAELMALEKLSGEDDGYSSFAAVPVSSSITSSSAPLDMPFLSDVKRTFLEDKRRGGKSTGALEEQFKAIDDFLEIIGSKPIDAYGKKDVREYLDVIQSIPPNAQKKLEFRNLGLKAVSERARDLHSPGPNIKTTHKKFDAISALFKWLGRHYDHMPPNPFDGMRPQERTNVRDERNPFTTDELKKIFSAPPYAGAQSRSRWLQPGNMILKDMGRYWLPLIALYTGCRLGEIMQMTKSDVKTEGILASKAVLAEKSIVCIEEPELHFHPELQRQFMKFIYNETDNQYFITTHSAHVMYAVPCSVHRVYLEDGISKASRPITGGDRREICHELGYKPSDLLQSNCVIWVEGPSDRVYLSHWLAAKAKDLTEGLHYSIMFYGGALRSHLSAQEETIEDFIRLLPINRFPVMVMDSDKDSSRKRINASKERIKEELSNNRGLCWVTKGREIENYIPRAMLEDAIKHVHKDVVRLTATDPIFGKPLNFQKKGQASDVEKGFDKVAIARRACETAADLTVLDLEDRVDDLVRYIRKANRIELIV